ncbi:MAG: hypothetical protein HKO05_01870 [Erythrobacter sp.]|nr:hypothetical protein [Erythrobacter sp.]
MSLPLIALIIAAGFAAIHLFAGRLRFLETTPRSAYLSAAGGIAVAYVFLHLLPELFEHRATFVEHLRLAEDNAETLLFSLALTGLVIFYGVERAILAHGPERIETIEEPEPSAMFWFHIAAFGIYNFLIGYLLSERAEEASRELVLYAIAMGVHFVTNDHGLRMHHQCLYDRYARWVLAAAVLAGAVVGAILPVGPEALAMLFALLGGGVILNVLKEELPAERESRFWPFALATLAYALLLAAL